MFGSKMPSFINLPAHNRFDYKPLYYDPDQEKKRKFTEKRITFNHGAAQEQNNRISGKFREQLHFQHKKRLYARNSSLRVVMLVGMLTLPLFYFAGYMGGYVAFGGIFLCFVVFIKKLGNV